MTSRDFAYWLQGFFEIGSPSTIGVIETKLIKQHLNLVFKHEIDPSMGDEKHQEELNKIHNKKFPTTEEEAIALFGEKPAPYYEYNIHGWYNPNLGQPRC